MNIKQNIHNFAEIQESILIEFHREFDGESNWWQICIRCGGKCEQYSIGSLMPGEKIFIAKWLNMPVSRFEDLYLDRIITPSGDIDVLKMKPGCPFLDNNFHCTIKPVKVVLCDIYPLAFEVKDNRVDFFLDPWCPLSQSEEASTYFEKVGIPALKKLNAPVEWYRTVALYDRFSYDYEKIDRKRQDIDKYKSFTLEQILAARVDVPSGEIVAVHK